MEIAPNRYNLQILSTESITDGFIYHFKYNGFLFDCILEDYSIVRLTWCFYNFLTEEEIDFWIPRYKLKVFFAKDRYNHRLINELVESEGLKVIIFRHIESLLQFQRDLKSVLVMLRGKKE